MIFGLGCDIWPLCRIAQIGAICLFKKTQNIKCSLTIAPKWNIRYVVVFIGVTYTRISVSKIIFLNFRFFKPPYWTCSLLLCVHSSWENLFQKSLFRKVREKLLINQLYLIDNGLNKRLRTSGGQYFHV